MREIILHNSDNCPIYCGKILAYSKLDSYEQVILPPNKFSSYLDKYGRWTWASDGYSHEFRCEFLNLIFCGNCSYNTHWKNISKK